VVDEEDDCVALFSAQVNLKALTHAPCTLIPARGVADDSKLVVEQPEVPKVILIQRSEWQGDNSESERGSRAVEVVPELEIMESGVDSMQRFDNNEEAVIFFSERVIAGRQMFKRVREAPTVTKEVDRETLALLCVDGKEMIEKSLLWSVPCAADVAASLPCAAVVVPHPGEQPPSPDFPQKKPTTRPPVHKRCVFNQIRDEKIESMVSPREQRRHPGVLRKLRKSLPQKMMVDVVEECYEQHAPPAPVTLPTKVAVVDAVAVARAAKMKGTMKIPKNLM
jgi:hypothetical protein